MRNLRDNVIAYGFAGLVSALGLLWLFKILLFYVLPVVILSLLIGWSVYEKVRGRKSSLSLKQ